MQKRIITAVVALAVFIPVLYFSHTFVFPLCIAVLSAVGCAEMLKCVSMLSKKAFAIPTLAIAALSPLLARWYPGLIIPALLLWLCYTAGFYVFDYKRTELSALAVAFFQILIITVGFTSVVWLRDAQPYTYLAVFIAAWSTDTFAYFVGSFLGKHKLCPDLSPKKTVEGAVGGIVGCVISLAVLVLVTNLIHNIEIGYTLILLSAVPFSVMGQIGDLSASAVKRRYGVKDYGNLFPGHGGVMDRFDSILPIAIMYTVVLNAVSAF